MSFSQTGGRCPSPGRRPARTAAGLCPAPALARRAPEGATLWTPAPRRGGVLRGQRQGSALHPRLCGGHPSPGRRPTRTAAGLCPAPFFRCGGDRCGKYFSCTLPRPPKGRRAGWYNTVFIPQKPVGTQCPYGLLNYDFIGALLLNGGEPDNILLSPAHPGFGFDAG